MGDRRLRNTKQLAARMSTYNGNGRCAADLLALGTAILLALQLNRAPGLAGNPHYEGIFGLLAVMLVLPSIAAGCTRRWGWTTCRSCAT